MKIDRFVRLMLVLIALLLALNCAKDLNRSSNSSSANSGSSMLENTVEAGPPPSFLQVGKKYRVLVPNQPGHEFIVLEISNTGWVKVEVTNLNYPSNVAWMNPSALLFIMPM